MKIAITYDKGEIFNHFEQAEKFKFFEIENKKIKNEFVVDANAKKHDNSQFLKENSITTLICNEINNAALETLKKANIQVFFGVKGFVNDSVKDFLEGNLKQIEDSKNFSPKSEHSNAITEYIQSELLKLQDTKYRDFHSKLIPTVNKNAIIGVRTPAMRKFAKALEKKAEIDDFLAILPHTYYEENCIHGFIIESEKDFEKLIKKLETFLPFVDNWATCDFLRPKIVKKHLNEFEKIIKKWLLLEPNSKNTYIIRFAINMLMSFYLEESFKKEHLEIVAKIQSSEYYINMMISWYFATALAKQYKETIVYVEQRKMTPWVINKTIQKARESFRITKEQKEYLKTLKI